MLTPVHPPAHIILITSFSLENLVNKISHASHGSIQMHKNYEQKIQPMAVLVLTSRPIHATDPATHIKSNVTEISGIKYGRYRKNSKIGTPEIITIIVLQLEQLDFTVQYCVQKMQTE